MLQGSTNQMTQNANEIWNQETGKINARYTLGSESFDFAEFGRENEKASSRSFSIDNDEFKALRNHICE